ncbi:MAG: hypothetical protein JXA69_02905 [Phycisphaerae bacterium]|nr:hypothetical protein [Phycisphaerae bacterium]
MEQSDLLRHLAQTLDSLELRYFVTGSIASTYFGEPRFTNDIDVVVDLSAPQVTAFCIAFPSPEFYVSEDAIRQAIEHRTQFNIIHPASGLKIDVMIPQNTPFDHSRFVRAKRIAPDVDFDARFASAEDVIIKKMEYYKEGGSEKHLRDIMGILRLGGNDIDRAYIATWATRLGLDVIWSAIAEKSGE